MKPMVAIIGRPNVGKSTLFNRLTGRKSALVQDVPGVTRDRHYGNVEWNGREFIAIDTGGFLSGEADPLLAQVSAQAEAAIAASDAVVLVVDAQAGLTAPDQELAGRLRKQGKPVVLAVNKVDTEAQVPAASELYRLGFSQTALVSAEQLRGLDLLLDQILSSLPAERPGELEPAVEEEGIRIAIVGRPNVGKSSLVNALLGEKRVVASEMPGTTRDPIDTPVTYRNQRFVLTDTAGIRRRSRMEERVEQLAVLFSLRAIESSQIVALVVDALEAGVDQDAQIAGLAEKEGRALLIVVNKWDRVERVRESEFRAELKHKLPFISYVPVIFTSALTGAKVEKVLEVAAALHQQWKFRAPTPKLNRWLEAVTDAHPPPLARGKPLRLYYIAQVSIAPPTFALTCNLPSLLPDHYQRYLTNQLRKTFKLNVPIRLLFRERPGGLKRASRQRPATRRRTSRKRD